MSGKKVPRYGSTLDGIRQGLIKRIDFLGDSITQGCGFVSRQESYPDLLLDKMKQLAGHDQFRTYNQAVGGATAADGFGRLHWSERGNLPPDLSFVMFGLNDVYQSVPIEDYAGSLGSIIDRLKHLGSEVVALGPTPFLSQEDSVRRYSLRAGQVAGQAQVTFVDCLSPFYENSQVSPGLLWPDGLHLTAQGHRLLGQWVWKQLEDMERSGQGLERADRGR